MSQLTCDFCDTVLLVPARRQWDCILAGRRIDSEGCDPGHSGKRVLERCPGEHESPATWTTLCQSLGSVPEHSKHNMVGYTRPEWTVILSYCQRGRNTAHAIEAFVSVADPRKSGRVCYLTIGGSSSARQSMLVPAVGDIRSPGYATASQHTSSKMALPKRTNSGNQVS